MIKTTIKKIAMKQQMYSYSYTFDTIKRYTTEGKAQKVGIWSSCPKEVYYGCPNHIIFVALVTVCCYAYHMVILFNYGI
jgi:hypothetical protein